MNIKDEDVSKCENNGGCNEMYVFNYVLLTRVYTDGHIFAKIPANWFFIIGNDGYPSHEKLGYALCISISILSSFLLLLFLW
jgi:hypothetical protein